MDEIWTAGDDSASQSSGSRDAFSLLKVLRWSLALVQEQPLLVLLGGFNMLVVTVAPSFLASPLGAMITIGAELDELTSQAVGFFVGAGVQLVSMPLQMLAMAGLICAIERYLSSGEVSISLLFTSGGAALRALLCALLVLVITTFIGLLFLAPGGACLAAAATLGEDLLIPLLIGGSILIIAGLIAYIPVVLGLMLGNLAAVLEEAGPTQAVALSWEAASGNRANLFLIILTFGTLAMIGACCCYLPAIPVTGMQWAGLTAAWLRYSRPVEETEGWGFFQRHGL